MFKRSQAIATLLEILTSKLIAARSTAVGQDSAALSVIMIFKPVAVRKQVADLVSAASSETPTCKPHVGQALKKRVVHQAAHQDSVALFGILTGKPIAEPRQAGVAVNAVLFATVIYKQCAAPRQEAAQASAALFGIPTCKLHAGLKQDSLKRAFQR
ncbi:hypothetical protein QWY27_09990 [Zwartia sp. IMCC34845]|nr:hypothetical protein [Zwartia vadi]